MAQESDPRGILGAIHEAMVYGAHIGLLPELHPWIAFFGRIFRVKIPFQAIADFIYEQLDLRKSAKSDRREGDFISKLLVLRENEKIDDVAVFSTLEANIAAGSDTTGISLSTVIYALIKHPRVAETLHDEIQQMEAKGQLSDPVTFQEAQKMPYLQAVLKESFRIHPATGQIMPRVVPAEGALLSGKFFPPGVSFSLLSKSLFIDTI